MYFNEIKYKKCINHLIAIKTCVVISSIIILACIGAGLGYPFINVLKDDWHIIAITSGSCAVIGLLIGLFFTWKIEMKIQESYWKIDILNELQNQTLLANKNTPYAKTVVAIENKQVPTNAPSEQNS